MTERKVDISKVDPHSYDDIDMFAYSSHLADRNGQIKPRNVGKKKWL